MPEVEPENKSVSTCLLATATTPASRSVRSGSPFATLITRNLRLHVLPTVSHHKGNGHLKFDIAELQRAYGEMKTSGENAQSTEQGNGNQAMTGHDTPKIVALLENQIQDLKAQLEKADAQLEIATTEKSKLLDLTDRLQKQNEVLMLPPEPQAKRNWWQKLTDR